MGLWRILSDLEEDGYRTEWGLFSAEETVALTNASDASSWPTPLEDDSSNVNPSAKRTSLVKEVKQGDTKFTGLEGFGDKARKRSQGDKEERSVTSTDSGEQLAHTASREPRQSQARNGGQDISGGSKQHAGPPREEQYEWEEPRVTQTQSELGGAVDGLTHRVRQT